MRAHTHTLCTHVTHVHMQIHAHTYTHPSPADVCKVEVPDVVGVEQSLELQELVLFLEEGDHGMLQPQTLLHQGLHPLTPRGLQVAKHLQTTTQKQLQGGTAGGWAKTGAVILLSFPS